MKYRLIATVLLVVALGAVLVLMQSDNTTPQPQQTEQPLNSDSNALKSLNIQ